MISSIKISKFVTGLEKGHVLSFYIPQFGYVSTYFFYGHINFNVGFVIIFSMYEIIIDLNSLL